MLFIRYYFYSLNASNKQGCGVGVFFGRLPTPSPQKL